MEDLEHFSRWSSIPLLSDIVRESFDKLQALESKIETTRDRISQSTSKDEKDALVFELMQLEDNLAKYAASVIVFSVTVVEAYIYDYAARHFSDTFVQNYLDKLDLVSKWVIIPRLVTGKELPRQRKWFELLKRLVRDRNSIVHSKSSRVPTSPAEGIAYARKVLLENSQIPEKARRAIQLLDELINEIQKIDPEEAILAEIYLSKRLEEA